MLKNSLDNYVISTRVRLARNFADYKFVPTLGYRDARALSEAVAGVLTETGFTVRALASMRETELDALKERYLISENLIKNGDIAAVALSSARDESVMILEEDHLRIQCILDGLELERAFERASATDDAIGARIPYVYDERLGYLTSCPTNLGTGMRASVMMFLPGLNLSGGINELATDGELGDMTFRGVYGEGSDAEGFLYQLSNRHTLGLSEREILSEVKESIDRIAEREERARETLLAENCTTLTDRIYRAWGLLTNSFTMSAAECAEHLAFTKLGVSLGLVRLRDARLLDRLTVECRPAVLAEDGASPAAEPDVARSAKLRERLSAARLA